MDQTKLFEEPFDYKEYLEKRLMDIEDLQQREFARSFVMPALARSFEESEKTYKRLEDRVYAEIEDTAEKYSIHMTVAKRDEYDITNGVWYPLLVTDEKPLELDAGIFKGTADGEFRRVDTVYLQDSLSACRKLLLEREVTREGVLLTSKGEVPASFVLRRDQRYTDLVEYFYGVFQANEIPWTTLNCGYLLRFMEVAARPEGELPAGAELQGYQVDFGKWEQKLKRDVIPVWNVSRQRFNSPEFVVPAIDTRYFEHEFPVKKMGMENGYLIEPRKEIVALRRTEETLSIITAEETFSRWTAYKVITSRGDRPYFMKYPVMHNARRDSFVKRYLADSTSLLQSKAEAIRRVEEFDTGGLVKLRDVSLLSDTTETYHEDYMTVMNVRPAQDGPPRFLELENFNWFIADELVNRQEQKVLLFEFEAPENDALVEDMVSFLVSQIQRDFNEYRCEAVLRQPGDTEEET